MSIMQEREIHQIPDPVGIYVRHSPSVLNMFAAEPAMFVLDAFSD